MAKSARLPANIFEPIICYFRKTDANYCKNVLNLAVGRSSYSVRMFLGVDSPSALTITGGMNWGTGQSLESIVFTVTRIRGGTKINLIEKPTNWQDEDAARLVKALVTVCSPIVHQRMVDRDMGKKKRGGKYTGKRLEAWKRQAAPKDHFNSELGIKFTQSFIDSARLMSVTYK
ncbi:MAG: hypothetical protein NTZ90_15210 [Proteobacteria bacterium]|nr:hypothetical protein [Pseudomonadota bacterium]